MKMELVPNDLNVFKRGGSLKYDGRTFKFKDSFLIKRAKQINKRDMRKKFIKSDHPTYINNRVKKAQQGMKFVSYDAPKIFNTRIPEISNDYQVNWDDFEYPKYEFPMVRKQENVPIVEEPILQEPIPQKPIPQKIKSKGLTIFNQYYDNVEKTNKDAKQFRDVLTELARIESDYVSDAQNHLGAPAYGYFQFYEDGKHINNISAFAHTDIDTFRKDPELQIKSAIKLIKSFKNSFSKEDLELAKQKGFNMNQLLAGAWLGGVGGVRNYLRNQGNPKDVSGSDVGNRMKNFKV